MIGFKEFVLQEQYVPNPIPVYFRKPSFVAELQKRVVRPGVHGSIRKIDSATLVNRGELFATQAILFQSMNDTMYPHIDHPVVVEYKGAGYILDGHLVIAYDLINKNPTEVWWVK